LIIDHVVQVRDFAFFIGNDGEGKAGVGDFVDVLDPFLVRVEGVGAQSDEFDTPFSELGFKFGKGAELFNSSATNSQNVNVPQWCKRE